MKFITEGMLYQASLEIFGEIQWSIKNAKKECFITHWLDCNYAIFVKTVGLDCNNKTERQYVVLKLQEYYGNECIDCEIDLEESKDISRMGIHNAIEILMKRNFE